MSTKSVSAIFFGGVVFVACGILQKRRRRSRERNTAEVARTRKNVKIRSGNKSDLPQIYELVLKLARFENSERCVRTTLQSLERDSGLFRTVVAVDGERIVGFAFFSFPYSTWVGKTVNLDDLYVEESYRQCGIGHKLLREVTAIGKSEGAMRMEWLRDRKSVM